VGLRKTSLARSSCHKKKPLQLDPLLHLFRGIVPDLAIAKTSFLFLTPRYQEPGSNPTSPPAFRLASHDTRPSPTSCKIASTHLLSTPRIVPDPVMGKFQPFTPSPSGLATPANKPLAAAYSHQLTNQDTRTVSPLPPFAHPQSPRSQTLNRNEIINIM
jgi:hypothetical protein